MSRQDQIDQQRQADRFAVIRHELDMLPKPARLPRHRRVKDFAEGYMTVGWVIRTIRNLF